MWQYSAIAVASAYVWAELHTSKRNPRARHTRELLHRVRARARASGLEAQGGAEVAGAEPQITATASRLGSDAKRSDPSDIALATLPI